MRRSRLASVRAYTAQQYCCIIGRGGSGAAGRGGQVRPVGTVVPGRDPGSGGGLRGIPEGKGTAMSEEPEFFTYTREEFLDEFVHPDDRPAVEEARQRRALQVRAEYLTEMRKKAGLTQAEVAE